MIDTWRAMAKLSSAYSEEASPHWSRLERFPLHFVDRHSLTHPFPEVYHNVDTRASKAM